MTTTPHDEFSRVRGPKSASVADRAMPVRLRADWVDHRSRNTALQVETVSHTDDSATVRVTGELDLGTAPPLWAVLRSHLAAGRRFLRLDVSALNFLDATALSGLHAVHRDALAARGTLVITGVRARVATVLRMSGLDEVLFVSGPRSGAELAAAGRLLAPGSRPDDARSAT